MELGVSRGEVRETLSFCSFREVAAACGVRWLLDSDSERGEVKGFEEQLWCGRWKRRFCDGDMVRYGAVASFSASLVSYYIPVLMPAGSNMLNLRVSSLGIVEDNCV